MMMMLKMLEMMMFVMCPQMRAPNVVSKDVCAQDDDDDVRDESSKMMMMMFVMMLWTKSFGLRARALFEMVRL